MTKIVLADLSFDRTLIELNAFEQRLIQGGGSLSDLTQEPLYSIVQAGIATDKRGFVADVIGTLASGGDVKIIAAFT